MGAKVRLIRATWVLMQNWHLTGGLLMADSFMQDLCISVRNGNGRRPDGGVAQCCLVWCRKSRKSAQLEAAPAGDLVKVQLVRVSGQVKEDGQAAAEETTSSGPVRLRSIRSKSSKDVLGSARRSFDVSYTFASMVSS